MRCRVCACYRIDPKAIAGPGSRTGAWTHAGFDDDDATLKQVLQFMRS